MSSEKGNISRKRPQKYQNSKAFKNDLHDKTQKTKFLNSLEISDVCLHCKGVLEWRIKFKKYKLMKSPKTCVKCNKKNVTLSYRVICAACSAALKVCPKCLKNETETLQIALQPVNPQTEEEFSEGEEEIR